MYPRILFLGASYRIVWDQREHGELGHAGWDAYPREGQRYSQVFADGFTGPASGILDFGRPKPIPSPVPEEKAE